MEINELEELRGFNELDLLYKLIEIAEKNKKRTEQLLRGNGTAGTDVRRSMQDIRLLAEFIRESIQVNKGVKKIKSGVYKGETIKLTKIEKAIVDKRESVEKEENYIKRAENLRRENKRKENVK